MFAYTSDLVLRSALLIQNTLAKRHAERRLAAYIVHFITHIAVPGGHTYHFLQAIDTPPHGQWPGMHPTTLLRNDLFIPGACSR